jgi:hypothetical protein
MIVVVARTVIDDGEKMQNRKNSLHSCEYKYEYVCGKNKKKPHRCILNQKLCGDRKFFNDLIIPAMIEKNVDKISHLFLSINS